MEENKIVDELRVMGEGETVAFGRLGPHDRLRIFEEADIVRDCLRIVVFIDRRKSKQYDPEDKRYGVGWEILSAFSTSDAPNVQTNLRQGEINKLQAKLTDQTAKLNDALIELARVKEELREANQTLAELKPLRVVSTEGKVTYFDTLGNPIAGYEATEA